jgi:hypothetical protein
MRSAAISRSCPRRCTGAARLSRQRRLGAEAAGGDRRGDAGLCGGIRQCAPRAALPLQPRDRALRGGARARSSASSARAHEEEIVFTTGSTMGINLVSYGWAAPRFEPGDEIVLSVMEHHANIVPWHFLRERQGAVLKWVEPSADGSLDAGAGDRRDRAAHEAGCDHPHVERARDRRRRAGHLRCGARARGGDVCDRRLASRGSHEGRTSPISASISTRSPGTSSTDPRGRARSTSGASGRPKCSPSSAAAT